MIENNMENIYSIEEEAVKKEKVVLQAIKDKNYELFASLLSEDFIQVASDGIINKKKAVKNVKSLDLKKFSLSSVKTTLLGQNIVIVSYKAKAELIYGGQDLSGNFYSSSVWVKKGEKFANVHHASVREEDRPNAFVV